jgi:hypothetical protein
MRIGICSAGVTNRDDANFDLLLAQYRLQRAIGELQAGTPHDTDADGLPRQGRFEAFFR